MASGDGARVWFKDVEAVLVSRWRDSLSGAELAALAADLTELTTCLREERGILPPIYRCRGCQTNARAKVPVIHVGGMIFAAKRLGLISDTEVSQLQHLWGRHSASERRAAARNKIRPRELQKQPASHRGCH